jgi:hypothetical protein
MSNRQIWLSLFGFIGFLGAAATFFGFSVHQAQGRATEVFRRHEADLAQKIARLERRKGQHTAIFGETLQGTAGVLSSKHLPVSEPSLRPIWMRSPKSMELSRKTTSPILAGWRRSLRVTQRP